MSAPSERVPRATAAQMAQRRLKAPRGRLQGGVSSTGSVSFTGGTTSNVFAQTPSGNNQISTPFGSISASFPPKPSSATFVPAPPSGSFTFGAQTASNPFSSLGTNTGNSGSNTNNFGGFGGQTNGPTNPQNDGDTMMESPQKKPPTFGATFDTGSNDTPSASPFSFGQSSQSVAPTIFGTSATMQPSGATFNFGQSQPAPQPGNLFSFGGAKPEEPKPQTSLFGQPTTTSQPLPNLFGQAASAPSSSSLFAQSTSAFNPPSNPFGLTPATSTVSANIFGSYAPATQPSTGGPFSTLFGQTPTSTKPANDTQTSSEASKPVFNFAPSTIQPSFSFSAAPAPTFSTMSSNFTPQVPESAPTSSAPDSTGSGISGPSNTSPFGDIFKPNANARLASPDTNSKPTEIPSTKSNPFTFNLEPPSSQPGFSISGGLFGPKPSEDKAGDNLFGRVTLPEEPASPKTTPVTLQKPIENEQDSGTRNDNGANTISHFGQVSNAESTSRPVVESTEPQETPSQLFQGFQPQTSTQEPVPPPNSSFSNLFSASSNKTSSVAQPEKQPSTNFSKGSLFFETPTASSRDASFKPADSQTKQQSWLTPKATASPTKPSSGSAVTHSISLKAPAVPQAPPASVKGSVSATSESDVRLRSYGASAIPAYLNSDESIEYDSLSRLRILNASFQKKVGKLDPAADDFEEIVRHYIAQRARIGHALNLKERKKAGMKRKMDNSEANEETLNGSKKARTEGSSSESSKVANPPTARDSSTTSATVQPPNTVATESTFQITGSSSNTGSSSATSGIFKDMMSSQAPPTTLTKSPPKKPAFEIPKFAPSSGASFMEAFAKQSAKSATELQEEAKRKRKAEDFDSDEDDEAEWERKYEEEERAKRSKLESLSKGATTGFQPLLGGKETSATAKKFFNLASDKLSSSGPSSEKTSPSTSSVGFGSTSTKRKAVEEAIKVDDEESNLSRSSAESGESTSQEAGSDPGSEEDDDHAEDGSDGAHEQEEGDEDGDEQSSEAESEDEDIQAAMARSKSKGSLFDRIEPNPNLKPKYTSSDNAQNAQKKSNGIPSTSFEAKATPNTPKASQAMVNSSFKPIGANGALNSAAFTSTPDAPTMSPFTPINGSSSDPKDQFTSAGSVIPNSKKPETENASISKKTNGEKFSFGSNTPLSTVTPARSVLLGGSTNLSSGAIPGEGLFGSRPSTPSNDEPSRTSVFGNLGSGPNFSSSKGDNTWKPGTPLKFGTPNKEGPTVNITAATPPAKDDSSAASKSFPNLFGPKPSKPGAEAVTNVGFNFGGPSHLTASPLLGPSAVSSAVSSRATSPGATDTESINTDSAEDHPDEPQTSLMSSRPGEEDEDVLWEGRSKALKNFTAEVAKEKKVEPGFNTQGVGQLRVLKHKTTSKTRILLRAEPGSNIVINTSLVSSMTYKAAETKGSGTVKFGIPTTTGIDIWVLKVKTAAMAKELADILEANKGEANQS